MILAVPVIDVGLCLLFMSPEPMTWLGWPKSSLFCLLSFVNLKGISMSLALSGIAIVAFSSLSAWFLCYLFPSVSRLAGRGVLVTFLESLWRKTLHSLESEPGKRLPIMGCFIMVLSCLLVPLKREDL